MEHWKKKLLYALILVAAVVMVYGPAYRAGYIWDDDDYVVGNAALQQDGGLRRIWLEPGATPQYYPATFTSFWIERRLWGLNPAGYHATNVLLHAANAALLWRILLFLGVPGAWFIALAFGLHPVHVESVAWITERKNTLSGLFYLLAASSYLRFRPPGGPPAAAGSRHYGAALAFFALALLSKTTTCSLPAALLVVAWWKRGRIAWGDVAPLAPFFLLGVGMAAMTVHMEATHVRADGPEWNLGGVTRLLIAARGLWFYVYKLAWPENLTFIYPRVAPDPSRLLDWWPALAAGLLGIFLWVRRARVNRGVVAALLFYAGTLIPALGFINVYPMRYSFVADHYVYLASIGPLALLGAAVAGLIRRAVIPLRFAATACAVAAILLGLATWQQSRMYRNLETLWATTIARNPSAWMAHNNLGLLRQLAGRRDEALAHYEAARTLHPEAPEVLTNLGNLDAERKAWADAERWHRAAISARPDFAPGWYNLGNSLLEQNRAREAVAAYERALRHKPRYPEALSNMAKARAQLGQWDDARRLYEQVLALEPGRAATWNNLAYLHLVRQRPADALAAADRALAIEPGLGPALHHRALALQTLNRAGEAAAAFDAALAAMPDHRQLLKDAGLFRLQTRDAARAEAHYRRALHAQFADADLHYALGLALAAQKRRAEALSAFRAAIELQSNHVAALNSAAWIAATDADADPARRRDAVAWAARAVSLTPEPDASLLSTLAAAQAAAGDFDAATQTARRAEEKAGSDATPERLADLRARIERYKQGLPHRE